MKVRVLFLCASACLIAACSSNPSPQSARQGPYWPTNGWRTSAPSAQGVNGAELDAAVEAAVKKHLPLHGLVVIRHGYIVKEKYFAYFDAGTAHELYSCTKSFVGALAGIAFQKGYLTDVTAPVLGFFPDRQFTNVDARKEAMRLADLLTMSAGFDWAEGDSTYREMYGPSGDGVSYILGLPMIADPGTRFLYCSGCSIVLSAIIQKTSGQDLYEFARENLFGPLGIPDLHWDRAPSGLPIGGWGLQLPPREMAKLGYLYLHDGTWDGKQLMPASWVRESTRHHIKPHVPGIGLSDRFGYGYHWWTDASIPMYAALGSNGQSIFVVPGRDLVVVFTGAIGSSSGDTESERIFRSIVAACTPGA